MTLLILKLFLRQIAAIPNFKTMLAKNVNQDEFLQNLKQL